jgi:hypothetical protein
MILEKEVKFEQFEHEFDIEKYEEKYERIINIKLVSSSEFEFKCYASCKIEGQRNVSFVEI